MEQVVLQVLLQGIADGALAIGAAYIQRHFVHPFHLVGNLRPAQDKSHLRPITMADDHIPALCDHISNVLRAFLSRLVLVLDSLVLGILD